MEVTMFKKRILLTLNLAVLGLLVPKLLSDCQVKASLSELVMILLICRLLLRLKSGHIDRERLLDDLAVNLVISLLLDCLA